MIRKLRRLWQVPRAAVIVFTILVVAGIWATAAHRITASRDQIRHDAESELFGAQKALQAHLRKTLETAQVLLAGIDHMLGSELNDMAAIERLIERMQGFDNEPIEIGLIGEDQKLWRLGNPRSSAVDVSDREYMRALASAEPGQLYISAVSSSRVSGRPVITLTLRTDSNRHGIDALLAAVPVAHFREAYSDFLISAPTYLGIARQDGLMLFTASNERNLFGARMPDGFLDDLRRSKGPSGVIEYTGGATVPPMLAGYAMLDKLPVTAFVAVELQDLTAKWHRQLILPLALGGIATLLTVGFMLLILALLRRRDAEAARVRWALNRAEAANEAKRHFMARMSHELRTPLNAILGFSEVIATGMLGSLSDTYRRYGQDIHRSGEHLLSLVNQVLQIARLESQAMPLNEENCDVVKVVNEAVDLVRAQAAARQLQIGIGDMPTAALKADPLLLRQMLLNLLSNAIKYTEPGGSIVVSALQASDGLSIVVSDTGRGISPDERRHVFEPFGRANAMVARPEDGMGLGLPIVRSLMALHGGRIDLRSAPRRGTAATLRFPQGRVLAA
ncbi:sensor histidine kinase [Ferrovibrio sp.]|uniref:sensor histidine kinase n=1 Tax=Ferrovibrio sp. TaxID=1917215 RepID=UPI003D0C1638